MDVDDGQADQLVELGEVGNVPPFVPDQPLQYIHCRVRKEEVFTAFQGLKGMSRHSSRISRFGIHLQGLVGIYALGLDWLTKPNQQQGWGLGFRGFGGRTLHGGHVEVALDHPSV